MLGKPVHHHYRYNIWNLTFNSIQPFTLALDWFLVDFRQVQIPLHWCEKNHKPNQCFNKISVRIFREQTKFSTPMQTSHNETNVWLIQKWFFKKRRKTMVLDWFYFEVAQFLRLHMACHPAIPSKSHDIIIHNITKLVNGRKMSLLLVHWATRHFCKTVLEYFYIVLICHLEIFVCKRWWRYLFIVCMFVVVNQI